MCSIPGMRLGRKLTALAEDFPEDKYDFKPTPAERSFAEQLLHAAGSCYYFTDSVTGKPLAEEGSSEARAIQVQGPTSLPSSRRLSRMAQTPFRRKARKGLTAQVVYLPQQKSRVIDIAYGIIEHSGEHYGQLVVYYRLAGLVPPESRPKQ